MTALDYLKSLIEASKVSSIPIQTSELELLKTFMEMEKIK